MCLWRLRKLAVGMLFFLGGGALCGYASRAGELLVEEDFSAWEATHYYHEGVSTFNNWRFFSVGGANGRLKRIANQGDPYLRLTRGTSSGDSGLDQNVPDQAVRVNPFTRIFVRIWARCNTASAILDVRLAEYNNTQWLEKDNLHQFELTDTFTPYAFYVTTSSTTNLVSLALRVNVGQAVEIQRIEMLPTASTGVGIPRILLPQGAEPRQQPTLWWRSEGHHQYQAQLSESMDFSSVVWHSGTVVSAANHQLLPALEADKIYFSRVRVMDFNDVWSAWSDPTVAMYHPLGQLPEQELYVYSLNESYGLDAAQAFEQPLMVCALQGLVNRENPRLYLALDGDYYNQGWLDKLREPGRWMEHVTLVSNGAQFSVQLIQSDEGTAVRLVRSNTLGDAGLDHGEKALGVAMLPGMAVSVSCRARAVSAGARLDLRMSEFDGNFTFLNNDNPHVYTLSNSFQDYTFEFTTSAQTAFLSPALRVSGLGTLDVRSIIITPQGQSDYSYEEDFETWQDGPWKGPGFWHGANGWRIFATYSPNIVELVNRFASSYEGVVLWDPAVPATSNVAATVAGAENLLPIPMRDEAGSLYRMLVTGGPKLTVKRSLVGMFSGTGQIPDIAEASSGSAKNDAYRWAIKKYLESGLSDSTRFGYYVDAFAGRHHNLTPFDFFIMKKGFLWDLSVWDDETPIDDPAQPVGTDRATLERMFATAAGLNPDTIIQCGGFPPFSIKYSNYTDSVFNAGGTHEPVPTEWKCAEILSAYNVELEADGVIPNCSVFTHMPRPERINQVPPPLKEECLANGWLTTQGTVANRTFVLHYVGDYDAPAWLNTFLPTKWEHPLRGRVPMAWGWDPNTAERGMAMFDEYMHSRTPMDQLWAGDSGAGYVNPNQLFEPRPFSGLPEGGEAWVRHCGRWFRMFDIRNTGFIINGNLEPSTDAMRAIYEKFSGDGIVDGWTTEEKLVGTMPVVRMKHIELSADPGQAARSAASLAAAGTVTFLPLRSILKDPGYYDTLNRTLSEKYSSLNPAFLLPSEFFYLLRHHLGGENHLRAAFIADTLSINPLVAGRNVRHKLWLRNLGWTAWENTGTQAVRVAVELNDSDNFIDPQWIDLPNSVEPGQLVQIEFDLNIPSALGTYYWRIDLCEGGTVWFGEHGNLPESRPVRVEEDSNQVFHWELFEGVTHNLL